MWSAFTISNSKVTRKGSELAIPDRILWNRFDISKWFEGPGTYAGVDHPIIAYAYATIEIVGQ
jgi:hypothetical protein